ncbi:MAG: ribosome maturation factor RimM [Propionibacteriales bacterium]|nr:ribosome maturation factor RimM [Propionibacteriales bacterium]
MTDRDVQTVEVLVGKIGRAHGIRGDLIIDVRTDEPDRRLAPATTFDTARGPLTIVTTRWHGRRLLVTFAEVTDRASAEALRGVELRTCVLADERPEDPDEFYDHQLIGLRAHRQTGEPLGEVADVMHLPAQDVLVVRHRGRDVLVPFVVDLVPLVDVPAGRLVVVDQPGLLDDVMGDPAEPTARVDDLSGA